MLNLFKKAEPILTVRSGDQAVCKISRDEIPCEKTFSLELPVNSAVTFVDDKNQIVVHTLDNASGWFHFSIRIHQNLACQADCVITERENFDPEAFRRGAKGIRFQPFYISEAADKNGTFAGKGLFARGMHFAGTISPGNLILSCVCDVCKQSFQLQSFHAGFSEVGYFYSDSGAHTLTVSNYVEGVPAVLSDSVPVGLSELEKTLPEAPDGTQFRYTNPFRCPRCRAPYIDFARYPEQRSGEYYGNHYVGVPTISWQP